MDEAELDDGALDTSGSGVLEPTLYCGSRGSITSLHAENDQLASFHQVSAGIKIWYSVTSTPSNTRKLLSLMRSMQWQCGMEEAQEEDDAGARDAAHAQLTKPDRDYGLKSHLWFINPRTLLELGEWISRHGPVCELHHFVQS